MGHGHYYSVNYELIPKTNSKQFYVIEKRHESDDPDKICAHRVISYSYILSILVSLELENIHNYY